MLHIMQFWMCRFYETRVATDNKCSGCPSVLNNFLQSELHLYLRCVMDIVYYPY